MTNNSINKGTHLQQRRKAHLSVALITAASAALISTAGAATRTVDNFYDDGPGSLRDAVRNSASGDTIAFAVAGVLPLQTGEIRVDHDLTITGPASGGVEVNGTSGRAFAVTAGRVTIYRLALSGSALGGSSSTTPGADAEGGALYNSGMLTLIECTLRSSFASGGSGAPGGHGRGGAIANYGSLTLLRSVIYGTSAFGGGGVAGQTGGTGAGGAIFNAGDLSLINTSIDGCAATGGSGGYGSARGGAGGSGTAGGIYNAGSLLVENSTMAANRAVGGSGGYADSGVMGNGGSSWGAGLTQGNGAVASLRNTVIATNILVAGASDSGAGGTSGPDFVGTVSSWGHNLIGRTDASAGWNSTDLLGGTTDATALNSGLGPLQDNGGPTLCRAPLSGSPLIDNGDDAALRPPLDNADQRGLPRRVGTHIDIGAVERGTTQTSGTFTVTTTDQHDDGTCSTDDCSFTEALNAANANPDPSTIDFAPGVTGTIDATNTPGGIPLVTPITIRGPGARDLSISGVGGGRVFFVAANVTISGITIRSGYRYGEDGAGIYNRGSLLVSDCTLSGNSAASAPRGGSALFNESGATVALVRSSVISNFSDREGGGIYNEGTLTATNCTFAKNLASNGGSILARPGSGNGSTTLRNCTFTASTAFGVGAGIHAEGSPQQMHIANSIVAQNTAYSGSSDVSGNFTSDGHNFIGTAGASYGFVDGVNGDQVGVDWQPKNAQLGGVGDNGGALDTAALLPGSPAINAGDDSLASSTDERGLRRNGVSDIGAFEYDGLPPSATPPAPITLVSAASRKTHGSSTVVDLALPVSGAVAIESRSGGAAGNHTLVLTFANMLSSVGSVTVTGGTGSVRSAAIAADPHQYVIELTGVANAQILTVTLSNVSDTAGANANTVSVSAGFLLGDVNGDGTVNAADAQITRTRSGSFADASNFRTDYNLDGTINSADAAMVRSRSGTFIP